MICSAWAPPVDPNPICSDSVLTRGADGTVSGVAKWLLKSEPDVFGYDDLVRNKREGWDGVRNYQARNFMREMRRGDRAIFYHSNSKPPGVAGICKIVRGAEADPTQFDPSNKYFDPTSKPDDPRWDWVTVAPDRRLEFVSLDELKTIPELAECRLLAKGNRLSVLPLTDEEFVAIVAYSDAKKSA
jgi:predicted RNA-binding protein with PUA-like domain